MKKPPIIEVRNLAVAYKVRNGEIKAVQDVSFTIKSGETMGIVGESGCGKSTVAWAIVNFLGRNGYISQGDILFQGNSLLNKSTKALQHLRNDSIAMVYQDPMQALNPSLTVGSQLTEVLTTRKSNDKGTAIDRSIEMLERVHMPDPDKMMRRYPHQISGGEQQRVVIAMALLNNPALLIMDEPTTALDVTVEATILDLLNEIRTDFDTAIMYITHNLGVVARICTTVGVMYAGEIVEHTPVNDLFNAPNHPYTQGLLRCIPKLEGSKLENVLHPIPGRVPTPNNRTNGCVYAPRCDYAKTRCLEERPLLRILPTDRAIRCHLSDEIDHTQWQPTKNTNQLVVNRRPKSHETILSLNQLRTYYPVQRNLFKDFFGIGKNRRFVKAVDGVTVDARRGKTLGIVGESGCGKSTLIKTIIGLEKTTSGEARYLGYDVTIGLQERSKTLIQALQMVFQNPDSTMNPFYTVGYQIGRPMQKFRNISKQKVRDEVINLLDAMRLGESYYDRFPHQLSGGEKQRVSIARALASQPDLILCDEPISSLDVSMQAAILNLLLDVQNEFETTLVFIAHDLSVMRFFCDEIAVMYLGQIMEIGSADTIYSLPYHPYTEALLSAMPSPDPTASPKRIRLEESPTSSILPLTGCPFHTRCPRKKLLPNNGAICSEKVPHWQQGKSGHKIFCHIPIEELKKFDPIINE